MKKATLLKLIEDNLYGTAYDIAFMVADDFSDEQDISEDNFFDNLIYEIENQFIYYSDAWDYLQDNNINDFSEAISEWNATDVCAIASYYANQEIVDALSPEWDSYEMDELEEEEDDE